MLQEKSHFFQRLLFLADLAMVVVFWLAAYWIRFEVLTPPEYVPLPEYTRILPWVLLVWVLVFQSSGLYAASGARSMRAMAGAVTRAVVIGLLLTMASLFLYRAFSYSRLMFILFGLLTSAGMISLRAILFLFAREAKAKSSNTRRVLIYGAGVVGRQLASSIRQYPWAPLEVVGFVDDYKTSADVVGTGDELLPIIDRFEAAGTPIEQVYLALPLDSFAAARKAVEELATRLVHVYMVPDLFHFDLLNSRVTHFGDLPVIHVIDESPPDVALIVKRIFDVVFSATLLLVLSPLLLAIAIAVKVGSPGPVFYQQERMGLNGRTFQMLKFRTMPVDIEKNTGPIWATADSSRATPVGRVLRRTSLDEIPQFINVLRGDMSVVGPRPERPVFIRDFRDRIPYYMLRHKTRAGITGWAQVNGWRGNTSLEKRIEYDLYYIRNWSLALDVKILLLTLRRGLIHENAY
jgi:exopolysaccharide biosynthesis polyprenyl glycosylphosphotransferase